jgi:hypothetical protein
LEPLPPSPAVAGETPADGNSDREGEVATPAPKARAHPLPEDWTPCTIDELSPLARRLVQQWPPGAYEAVSEKFRLNWINDTRKIGRKTDWRAAHAKWLIGDHSQVMRDAKAGVSFAALAPSATVARATAPQPPTPAKAREDAWSQAVHATLKRDLGMQVWQQWFERCAVLVEPDGSGVTVIAPSEFQRNFVEQQHGETLRRALRTALAGDPGWVRYEYERPRPG